MDVSPKCILFFLFLNVVLGQSEPNSTKDVEGNSRQFHTDEHKDTRESIKTDMDTFISNLWERMTKRNAETILKLEKHQEALSANLSREFNENMGHLYRNLSDSFTVKSAKSDLNVERTLNGLSASLTQKIANNEAKGERSLKTLTDLLTQKLGDSDLKVERSLNGLSASLTQKIANNGAKGERSLKTLTDLLTQKLDASDLKVERSLNGLSASLTQKIANNEAKGERSLKSLRDLFTQKLDDSDLKVETSLGNISNSFGEQLLQSESKLMGQLGILNETLRTNHQQLSHSISHLTSLTPTSGLTEVEVVNAEHGTIYFNGGTNSQLRRKIWIFQSEGGDSYREMSLVMQKMRLGANARLFHWDSFTFVQHEWKGSQSEWKMEHVGKGNVILVTLTISPGAAEMPSFKLKFNTTSTYEIFPYALSSEVLRRVGQQVVSYPSNNTENYPPMSLFVAVVAPQSGRSFGLTMKYLDINDTSSNCTKAALTVWSLDETATEKPYEKLPLPAAWDCGTVGAISESLGNSTVAILRFVSNPGPVGKGFRVEFN